MTAFDTVLFRVRRRRVSQSFATFAMLGLLAWPIAARVVVAEDFERGVPETRMSVQTTGTFSAGPGVKNVTNFGSTKAFGFGLSTCGASCFFSFVNTLRITFPAPEFVVSISFKEMELFSNWGSGGGVFIDGQPLTAVCVLPACGSYSDFGRLPQDDRQPDTTFRSRSFPVNRAVTTIELRVANISNLSEIYIDDLIVEGAPGDVPQILPQFAFGGGWYSALYFTNTSSSSVSFPVSFVGDDGRSLSVPSVGGSSTTVSLAPRGTAVIEAPNSGPLNQGYVSMPLPAGVVGYGVFRQSVPGRPDQEAVVPLSGVSSTTSTLIWDDTNFVTGVAIVNPSSLNTTVAIVVRDLLGVTLGNATVPLAAKSKVAVALRDFPGLGTMAGKRGSADFTVAFGNVAVLGLRFAGSAFTSIPTTDR